MILFICSKIASLFRNNFVISHGFGLKTHQPDTAQTLGQYFFNRIASCTAVTKNLRKVLPDDYDKETLWAAVQEGRVYIDVFQEVSKESVTKNVRAYVKQLHPLTTDNFREHVDEVWERIFAHDELFRLLIPSPKARKFRSLMYKVIELWLGKYD